MTNHPTPHIDPFGLFDEGVSYFNGMRLYYYYFNLVPNMKTIHKIDGQKYRRWIEAELKENILKKHFLESYDRKKKKMRYDELMFVLKNKVMLNLERDSLYVLFAPEEETTAHQMMEQARKFAFKRKRTSDINLIVEDKNRLFPSSLRIKKPKLKLATHYNDDLIPVHNIVLKTLRRKAANGLILFHGLPGTGKSTYIKYLINLVNKPVFFLPPKLAGNLDSPELTSFLVDWRDSIFIIEDAEQLIVSRDANQNSSISMLLNLTDGLLGESLGIQVIATFNTAVSNIDKALTRKGRLTAMYEFKELNVAKVKQLLEQNGMSRYEVTAPMTLAEVYNISREDFGEHLNGSKRPIGFNTKGVSTA